MPAGAAGIIASPDGKTVLVTDAQQPELAVIDASSDSLLGRVSLQDQQVPAQRVRWSPDGRHVVVTTMEQPLVTVLDGRLEHQSTFEVPAGPMGVAFASDGRTALVANHNAGQVTVIDLDDRRAMETFPAGKGIETLAYY